MIRDQKKLFDAKPEDQNSCDTGPLTVISDSAHAEMETVPEPRHRKLTGLLASGIVEIHLEYPKF